MKKMIVSIILSLSMFSMYGMDGAKQELFKYDKRGDLHQAVANNNTEEMKLLLKKGADVDSKELIRKFL